MYGEHPYYAARSGLTPPEKFSVEDHKRAYFRLSVGSDTQSVDDLEGLFIRNVMGITSAISLSDLRYLYFASLSGLTPVERYTVADHRFATFLAGLTGTNTARIFKSNLSVA